MKAIIKGNVLILIVNNLQYIQLVEKPNFESKYFKKWQTEIEVQINSSFEVNYCHAIEIEVDGNDCIIDEHNGEYYLVTGYTF